MSKSLPTKPSLAIVKREAQKIHKAFRSGEPHVCSILRHLHHLKGKTDDEILNADISLSRVQFAIAMEYGFESWRDLKDHVEKANGTFRGERILEDALAEALKDDAYRILISSMTGETDPVSIAKKFNAFTERTIGRHIAVCHMLEISVGMAFGLTMDNGQRILLKIHGPDVSQENLDTVYRIKKHLKDNGFPLPAPLYRPSGFGNVSATIDEFFDDGSLKDARQPEIRKAMAEGLYRQIDLCRSFVGSPGLNRWGARKEGSLWPVPHNALFDFDKTTTGAEYIDEVAGNVAPLIDKMAGDMIVAHADWAVKHFLFKDAQIAVVYDWDSLQQGLETQILGNAASTFTFTDNNSDKIKYTDPDECIEFVREYERARQRKFTPEELESISAAATYVMAYRARCEHAIFDGKRYHGSCREALKNMKGHFYFEF